MARGSGRPGPGDMERGMPPGPGDIERGPGIPPGPGDIERGTGGNWTGAIVPLGYGRGGGPAKPGPLGDLGRAS